MNYNYKAFKGYGTKSANLKLQKLEGLTFEFLKMIEPYRLGMDQVMFPSADLIGSREHTGCIPCSFKEEVFLCEREKLLIVSERSRDHKGNYYTIVFYQIKNDGTSIESILNSWFKENQEKPIEIEDEAEE